MVLVGSNTAPKCEFRYTMMKSSDSDHPPSSETLDLHFDILPPPDPPSHPAIQQLQTLINGEEALINREETLINGDETLINREETLINADETLIRDKRKRGENGGGEETEKNDNGGNGYWKTSLCSYFRKSASCRHGAQCRFAHGEEELRLKPDNTWDPTSEKGKRLKKENDKEEGEEVSGVPENDVMMTEFIVDGYSDHTMCRCLVHLPMNWKSEELVTFLNEQEISFKSAKKKKGMTVGFVNFETSELVSIATEALEGKCVKNRTLKVADVVPRSFERKKLPSMVSQKSLEIEAINPSVNFNNTDDDGCGDDVVEDGGQKRRARDVVTPLASVPYSEQLERKKASVAQTMKQLTRSVRKACPSGVTLPDWIIKSREIGGLPCELKGIMESPIVEGYRNKCEFSVGYSRRGNITVGFMLGNFREGVTAVHEPVDCPNVSTIASSYALIFQRFLEKSELPVWNRLHNTGFWRQLTVREGRVPIKNTDTAEIGAHDTEVMLIVQICSVEVDEVVMSLELEKMAEAFTIASVQNSPSLPLTCLVLQEHNGISNVAPSDAPLRLLPLSGAGAAVSTEALEARIHCYMCDLRFCISPTAFFQVNTLAAERLYSVAGGWADLTPQTLLFDICCGTGTIGLTLARHVGMVVGVEMNESAVCDARRNAEINGIENCRFVCGKAEDVVGPLLAEYVSGRGVTGDGQVGPIMDPQFGRDERRVEGNDMHVNGRFENVVAIVDPPRSGLHPTVIRALRVHEKLRRLVYISCNPETMVANAIELCAPSAPSPGSTASNNKHPRRMSSAGVARHRAKSIPPSRPFIPVRSMAFDLFPHTPHCEILMLLHR